MIWVILLCSIFIFAIDYMIARRWSPQHKKLYLVMAGAISALPLMISAVGFLFIRDNTTLFGLISMWVTYVYMILAVARLPLTLSIVASQRAIWRIFGGVISIAVVVLFVYSMVVTRTDYKVNKVEIVSSRLPGAFDGYRIVQISDLHVGTMLSPKEELQEIVEICNGLDADMIVQCGDVVNIRYTELTEEVVGELSQLRARDGVYAITGNHDVGVYIKDSISTTPIYSLLRVKESQQQMGWRVIDSTTEYVKRGGDSISITGIGFDRRLQDHRHSHSLPELDIAKNYKGVPKDVFNITLVHMPQLWDDILRNELADLTLSGHVHAMQLKLPFGKRGISPSMLLYKRWSGLYQKQGRSLYINDGIGCVMYPMRIGLARPEITLIELQIAR